MIEAGGKALEDGSIDTYTVSYGDRGYEITVTSGSQTGTGYGMTEDDAFADAKKNMGKADKADSAAKSSATK